MIKKEDIEFSKLTNDKLNLYELFLERNKNFLWYSSLEYKSFFESYLNCESIIYIAERQNNIVGSFPLFLSNDSKYGKVINSLPFYGSNGAFLLDESLTSEDSSYISSFFLTELNKLTLDNNISSTTIITSPFDTFSNEFLEKNFKANYTDFRIGQITPLPDDGDLMKIYQNPRPRNIRKAINSGVIVKEKNDKEAFDFLMRTHQLNINNINGKYKDEQFFKMIQEKNIKNTYKLYIAEIDNNPIAALLLFYFNQTVEYYIPCTVEYYRKLQPSSLIIYKAMKDAIKMNYKFWNWGGTWKNQKGVYDFKKKWGAIDMKYQYFTKLNNKKLKDLSVSELENQYPHFYTIPYDKLKND